MPDFYGTIAGFRTYHGERRGEASAAYQYPDEKVGPALLVASEWLDNAVRSMLHAGSYKVGAADQMREFPRTGLIDSYGYAVSSETVPTRIEYATYELAERECASPGALTKDFTPSKYKRVSVEGAASVEYRDLSAGDVQAQFPIVWQILGPLLRRVDQSGVLSGQAIRV